MEQAPIFPMLDYGDKGWVASAEGSEEVKEPEQELAFKSNEEEEVLEKPPQLQEESRSHHPVRKAVKRLRLPASDKDDDELMSDDEPIARKEKGMTPPDTSRSRGKLPGKKSAVKPVRIIIDLTVVCLIQSSLHHFILYFIQDNEKTEELISLPPPKVSEVLTTI